MHGASCNFLNYQPLCSYLKVYTKVFVNSKIPCTLNTTTLSVWGFIIRNIESFHLICTANLHNLLWRYIWSLIYSQTVRSTEMFQLLGFKGVVCPIDTACEKDSEHHCCLLTIKPLLLGFPIPWDSNFKWRKCIFSPLFNKTCQQLHFPESLSISLPSSEH